MANELSKQPPVNPVKALQEQISAAKSMKELLAIDTIRNRYIKNYEAVTQRKDGSSKYERDVLAFMEKVNSNPSLMGCDPFSIFAAFVKVGSYGLSPDKLYLQPQKVNGKTMMKVDPDPFGKKEMLERMPTIRRINDPVLVYKNDVFAFSPKTKQVTKHEQVFPLPKPTEETIQAVYCTIDWANGKSEDYVLSLEQLKIRKAKSRMDGGGELWKTHFGEAAKKSVINYIFKTEYKQPEAVILYNQYEGPEDTDDDTTLDITPDETVIQQASSVSEDNFQGNVNEETGEVYTPEIVKESKKGKDKKTEDEPFI